MTPIVSVLMPVYNGARFLQEAVDTILAQSFRDFEFIVVDDGSTDATSQLLKRRSDSRMVLLQNSTNLGLPSSLNRGLSKASGKYIARQDADDLSFPERLKEQVRFLDQHLDTAVVGADYIETYEDRPLSNRIQMPKSDLDIKWHGLFQSPIAHATSVFRREVITAAGGYSTESNALHVEDYDLWSRLIWNRQKLANLSAPLVRVRCDPAGVSRSNPDLQHQNFRSVVQRNLQQLAPSLRDDRALANLVWRLQVCGGVDEPLEQVEKALKALEELMISFSGYFQLDSREQRRVRQMAHRRAAKTLLHNARQYTYAGRTVEAKEFARLALSLNKRLAFSKELGKVRVKGLLSGISTERLKDTHKRIRRAIHF
jgi:Glycosyl transferase family 2